MTNEKRFSEGVVWSYLQSWGARGITTLGYLILGWYLEPPDFGVFAIVSATLVFVEMLCEQSLSQTLVQLKRIDPGRLNVIFFLALICGLIAASAILMLSDSISFFFGVKELDTLLKVAAVCPVLIGLGAVPVGLLRRNMEFRLLARRTVLSSGLSTSIGIGLVVAGFGVWGLVIQAVVYYSISLIVLWMHCEWRPGLQFDISSVRRIVGLASWAAVSKFSDFAETRGLELMIGALGGVHALGVFAFASKLAHTAFQILTSPILDVVFTDVARHRSGPAVINSIKNGQLVVATLPSVVLFALACGSEPLLSFLYSDRWSEATRSLSIMSLALIVRGMLFISGSALLGLGAARLAAILSIAKPILTFIFFFVVTSMGGGGDSGALGYLGSPLLLIFFSYYVLSKKVEVSMRDLIKIPIKVVVSLFLSLIVYWMLRPADGNLTGVSVVAVLSLCLFLFLLISLNAGSLVVCVGKYSEGRRWSKWLAPVEHVAANLLKFRESIFLVWFELTLGAAAFFHRSTTEEKPDILVVPGDTVNLDGSLGDQALFEGLCALVEKRRIRIVVSEKHTESSAFKDSHVLKAWDGLGAGWKLGKQIRKTHQLFVIGADVLDGYYSERVSRQRLILAKVYARNSVSCSVVSFSLNESPPFSVIREFQSLPAAVRICPRDSISFERFGRLIQRPAQLVADLAFLVEPVETSAVAQLARPWIATERRAGRRILGVNVNPQVVAHLAADTEAAIAASLAASCEILTNGDVSIVLIPHDFRAGCADLRVIELVWGKLSDAARAHSLILNKPFLAKEIKTVCRDMDLVFSARMHLAIGALSVGTPVCSMQYQGKFDGLFRHFDQLSDVVISPEDGLDSSVLSEFLQRNLDRSGELRKLVGERLPVVKALAKLNAS